ncbi:hypothetical protein QYZ88_006930 [Lachnospiraceae bacterium C1.1]|nr:hypothetical protein [Lachnospiraceae bacterium C1.1]
MDSNDLFEMLDQSPDIDGIGSRSLSLWYGQESLIIIISGTIPDADFADKDISDLLKTSKFLSDLNCKLFLLLWKEHDEIRAYFKSDSSRVRALDFLNVFMSDAGLVKGDSRSASGRIASATLWLIMGEMDLTNQIDYFKKMSISYFKDCNWIIADEYSSSKHDEILNMTKYTKKHLPWAVVKSVDIAPAGSTINIKTLENDSGVNITTDDNTYIMIGIQGEVYNIDSKKFDNTYDLTDEPLDIFARMTLFIPEVTILPDNEYMNIDEIALICYPKNNRSIYAKQLDRRTKVFPVYDRKNYFLGNKDDFLAVRTDDLSDIYIIQKRIFLETYEEAK